MLRSALALLSTLQIGLRIREAIERGLRQAILVAVAVLLLVAAAFFGLLAGYQTLVLSHGFSPPEAAATVAAALAALGLIVLAAFLLLGRRRKPAAASPIARAGEGVGLIDQGFGKAMQQVGPVGLLAIAFVAGLLASRRR
jgi:hypothetical protein